MTWTSGQLASCESGRGLVPVGGTPVGGWRRHGRHRGRRRVPACAARPPRRRRSTATSTATATGGGQGKDAVPFASELAMRAVFSIASRVVRLRCECSRRSPVDLTRWRRLRTEVRVADVTAHHRQHEVPHRLVALLAARAWHTYEPMLKASSSLEGCTPAALERFEVARAAPASRARAPDMPPSCCGCGATSAARTRRAATPKSAFPSWRSLIGHAAAADQQRGAGDGAKRSRTRSPLCTTGAGWACIARLQRTGWPEQPSRVDRGRLLDGGDEIAGHRRRAADPSYPSRADRRPGSRSARCGRRRRGSARRTYGCCPAPDRNSRSSPPDRCTSGSPGCTPTTGCCCRPATARARRGRATSTGRAAAVPTCCGCRRHRTGQGPR